MGWNENGRVCTYTKNGEVVYIADKTLADENDRATKYWLTGIAHALSIAIPFYGHSINPVWGQAYAGLVTLCVFLAMIMTGCTMMGSLYGCNDGFDCCTGRRIR